jgi:uncharacterized protein
MNCRETIRVLNGYVDDELDLAGALAVEEHLRACSRCRGQETGLRALRSALRRGTEFEAAPDSLRQRLQAHYGREATTRTAAPWPRPIVAVAAVAALALAAWIGFARVDEPQHAAAQSRDKIVYHITSSGTASAALRTLRNHLEASPDVKVVVVAHNEGIDFLLRGARDESGQLYEATIKQFRDRGVDFRVCNNTLVRRKIDSNDVVPGAALVPSGIAEIGRLQGQEGYLYMRL